MMRGQVWGYGLLPADTVLRTVGWLGSQVSSLGNTREECIEKLFHAYERKLVLSDGSKGPHVCEICTGQELEKRFRPVIRWRGRFLQLYAHGHYLVRNENIVYMCPALVLHYILDHQYRPPDEFVEGVIGGRFLTKDDLVFVEDKPRGRKRKVAR